MREIEVGEHLGLQAAIFQHRQNEDTGMVVIFQNSGFRRGRDSGASRLNVRQFHDFFDQGLRRMNRPLTQPDV